VDQQPTVGRIVHYTSYGSPVDENGEQRYKARCRAAIVTQTLEGFMGLPLAGLAVLNPSGVFFEFGAQQDPAGCASDKGGTWHWPERV
jgi:hypothetical protein